SLIVMGIIIALTYTFIMLMGKQLYLFEDENTHVLEYNLFNATILNDINNSVDFSLQDNKLELINYDDTKVFYTINQTHILRQNNMSIIDSFKIKNVDYYILKDNLKIKMMLLGDTIQTNYFLIKDNAQLINQTIFHED